MWHKIIYTTACIGTRLRNHNIIFPEMFVLCPSSRAPACCGAFACCGASSSSQAWSPVWVAQGMLLVPCQPGQKEGRDQTQKILNESKITEVCEIISTKSFAMWTTVFISDCKRIDDNISCPICKELSSKRYLWSRHCFADGCKLERMRVWQCVLACSSTLCVQQIHGINSTKLSKTVKM